MKKRMLFLMSLIAVLTSLTAEARSVILGRTVLTSQGIAGRIYLGSCGYGYGYRPTNPHRVDAIQLQITNAGAQLDDVLVRFGNQRIQMLTLRDFYQQNSTTHLLDLTGDDRCVEEITVRGRSLNGWTNAMVTVIGHNFQNPPTPYPPGPNPGPYPPGPFPPMPPHPPGPVYPQELLGMTEIGFNHDVDVISFYGCANNATHRAIRVHVLDNAVNIDSLQLQYANGEIDPIEIRSLFQPGTGSRVIDLNGNDRCIRSIQVVGSTLYLGPRAKVQIFGIR